MTPKYTTGLLAGLRALMRTWAPEQPLAAYIVPSADAHNSEYLAECDMQRAFISGFTGSAGTAVVTETHALLWTDGRYYLQAERELDSNWTLMRESVPSTPTQAAWLCANVGRAGVVGADPTLVTHTAWSSLAEQLTAAGHRLVPIVDGLVEQLWPNRPARPARPARVLAERFAGRSVADKLEAVRRELSKMKATALVLSALDEVAWLLNLRGSDIDYNPVLFAYLIVSDHDAYLFTDEAHLTDQVRTHLHGNNVIVCPYEDAIRAVGVAAAADDSVATAPVLWFGTGASRALTAAAERAGARVLVRPSPVALAKAIKNETEVAGMRAAHIRDSAALCRYLAWLEERTNAGEAITEVSGAKELERLRADTSPELYVGPSFETISATGPNAAIVHYRPATEAGGFDAPVLADQLYLVDSGGQYLDGTTDVTRTVLPGGARLVAHLPNAAWLRKCFTLVLRGQLRLGGARFPSGVLGNRLDTLARQFLWDAGLDYAHGTGHGVGHHLCVHEGPMGVSWRAFPDDPGLRAGMCISNEPGYYEPGSFGIRHENVAVLVAAGDDAPDFLQLDTLTLVPIQTALVERAMLNEGEASALNLYHARCLELVEPELHRVADERALAWLRRETQPI